jgi:glycine dehydrogenase
MTSTSSSLPAWLSGLEPPQFASRHLGSSDADLQQMCASVGTPSLDHLTKEILPPGIVRETPIDIPAGCSEEQALSELRAIADQNTVSTSLIGQGYHPSHLPPVILRNILENPGWYTQYTPYQAEIAQGRLEMLLNFQTLVTELAGLPFANASLLDEATAFGEALGMAVAQGRGKRTLALVDEGLHPQNLEILKARARSLNLELQIGNVLEMDVTQEVCAVLLQSPDTEGRVRHTDLAPLAERTHEAKALLVVGVDPLAQCLLDTPGPLGADIVVGSTQRFGLPMGCGGPHAGFMATTDALKRRMPGRIVGVSIDTRGKSGYRLALQTREQHIRREKATSNICTAQALPAILATAYAMYHGPDGLHRIAARVATLTRALRQTLQDNGIELSPGGGFDTVVVLLTKDEVSSCLTQAEASQLRFRKISEGRIGISLNETTSLQDLNRIAACFGIKSISPPSAASLPVRTDFLKQEVFNRYHSEHEMLRYLHRLQGRDLSLTHSMISLGSCTMKLNATAEMIPVTWPEIGHLHPAAPEADLKGYERIGRDLEAWLSDITCLPACSLQPNAGSQGELAGLVAIREYHLANGEGQRSTCLIPTSAHGTNPASAVMAGFEVVAVACDQAGNVDLEDLQAKIDAHRDTLGALMITYPSTHGVFEAEVKEICKAVHQAGGQVYMDGANMNAQVGITAPGLIGADVCHLNLHKTFCIPHGGGGPGMGPICAGEHLRDHLPTSPFESPERSLAISATPIGSGSILVISWMYIRMMGPEGLRRATQVALLNANYMAKRLEQAYPVLYKGANGRVAHEFILDLRELTAASGLKIDDIAKRLIDYGFHAPTMSFPVPGTLMVEPTESESRAELDRFCQAMESIRKEIQAVLDGDHAAEASPLAHAPHTADDLTGEWDRVYSRTEAAFPLDWVRERKFWPYTNRIDNTYGDRNLICTCEWDPTP